MPAYYNEKTKKWYCSFYYNKKKIKKSGFKLKREAEAYEREYLTEKRTAEGTAEINMPWVQFVELFQKESGQSQAEHTRQTRGYQISNHIIPAFTVPISQITAPMLQEWTDSLPKTYSLTHSRNIYRLMRAIFNHAERLYGLNPNPVKLLRPPTKREVRKPMKFWSLAEFETVIQAIDNPKAKTAIILLFYSGIRKGELLALTWNDLQGKYLNIDKSYQRLNSEDVVTPPKTASSVRKILLPSQALEALNTWRELSNNERIFEWEKYFIENAIKQACAETGIKRIRVHDLRHSHASFLISKGANIKLISARLGHAKTSMTLDTYGHLYPSDEQSLIDIIETEKNSK